MRTLANAAAYTTYGTEYSQYRSTQTNECGNGYFATQIMCSNGQASIQGSENIITGLGYQTSASCYHTSESNSIYRDDNSPSNGEQPTNNDDVAD